MNGDGSVFICGNSSMSINCANNSICLFAGDNPNYGYTIKDNLITGPGKNLFNESIFEI